MTNFVAHGQVKIEFGYIVHLIALPLHTYLMQLSIQALSNISSQVSKITR